MTRSFASRAGHNARISAADVRYAARWLLRIVGERSGRLTDHDRRLIAVAVTLHMKALV